MQAASFVNRAAVFLEPELMRFANSSFTSDEHSGTLSEAEGRWVLSTTLAASSIGALVGFLLLPYAMSYCGPRDTSLLISNVLLLLAIAFHVSLKGSWNASSFFSQALCVPFNLYELYMVGRFLVGINIGLAPSLIVYISESVPTSVRGTITLSSMVVTYVSQALGALLTAKPIFGNDNAWYLYPVVKTSFFSISSLAIFSGRSSALRTSIDSVPLVSGIAEVFEYSKTSKRHGIRIDSLVSWRLCRFA